MSLPCISISPSTLILDDHDWGQDIIDTPVAPNHSALSQSIPSSSKTYNIQKGKKKSNVRLSVKSSRVEQLVELDIELAQIKYY